MVLGSLSPFPGSLKARGWGVVVLVGLGGALLWCTSTHQLEEPGCVHPRPFSCTLAAGESAQPLLIAHVEVLGFSACSTGVAVEF